jgi:hypothetical protein
LVTANEDWLMPMKIGYEWESRQGVTSVFWLWGSRIGTWENDGTEENNGTTQLRYWRSSSMNTTMMSTQMPIGTYLRHLCTNRRLLVFQATLFRGTVYFQHNYFCFSLLNTQMGTVHMDPAESARQQWNFEVTPELWVISMKRAPCSHLAPWVWRWLRYFWKICVSWFNERVLSLFTSGALSVEVDAVFLENFCFLI